MEKLEEQLQLLIKDFCVGVSNYIVNDNPRIKSLVIQYNNDHIFIGKSSGSFYPDFYDEYAKDGNPSKNKNLTEFIKKTGSCLTKCYQYILNNTKHKKIRGYNIRYSIKSSNIIVTLNRMGNLSIRRSQIFEEFN